MASFDLPGDGALSQRIAASRLHQRQGEGLLVPGKDVWVQTCGQKPNEEGSQLAMGLKRDGSRGSIFSGISSSRSRGSSNSSQASSTHFRQSSDVVQATPPRLAIRNMDFYSSLGSSQPPFKVERGDADWEVLQNPLSMSNLEAEAQVSPSPRSAFPPFTTAKVARSRATPSEPLDRYLEQKVNMANIGGNLKRLGDDENHIRFSRIDGLRLRTQLRDKRKDLKTKRLAKSSADDAFMKYVRERRSSPHFPPFIQNPQDTALDALYEAMQTTRDEYGEAEFAYNELEDLVDEHEFDLGKMEGRLYNIDIDDIPDPPSNREPPPPESLLGISSDAPKEYHPFHISYLTRLGDLDLARERYHNMVEERDNLLLRQESQLPLGIELHDNGKEFLANFHSQEAAILGDIVEIEEDVERRKEKCLAECIELDEESSGS